MVADPDPRSYSYQEAARILGHLDFERANPKAKGSHRLFRRVVLDAGAKKHSVYVSLVDAGKGTVKPEYIKQMVGTLQAYGLIPPEV